MIAHQLLRPFAFNKIISKELNWVRYYVPAAATFIVFVVYVALPKKPEIIGDKKYLDYMLQVVGILPGFYIAALAAGATFLNPSLDESMPGRDPPKIPIVKMGKPLKVVLTTRIFICHLFAYLSAASLVLAFAILAAIIAYPSSQYISEKYGDVPAVVYGIFVLQSICVLAITFYAAKLTTITLHGLYFLAERMHLSND